MGISPHSQACRLSVQVTQVQSDFDYSDSGIEHILLVDKTEGEGLNPSVNDT